jgi:hypothetical protein
MRPPIFLLAFLAACDVGQINGPPGAPVPDAPAGAIDGPSGGPDGAPASGGPDAAPSLCRNQVQTADSGHHNAGANCGVSGCHGGGGGGPVWTVSGTLYASAAGATALAGATITVVDANGATHDIVSALNGNFYTGEAIPLPATVFASSCPNISKMTASISLGSCNSCHVGGNATGAVHLP